MTYYKDEQGGGGFDWAFWGFTVIMVAFIAGITHGYLR